MKKILLPALAILFAASSLTAQERQVSPLIQETLEPSPTVVRTYEPFQVNYRLTFLDLSEHGKEIEVLESRLQPSEVFTLCSESESATLCAEEDFNLDKYETAGNHVWEITYTLRRIGPNKGTDTIPPVGFSWALKDAGRSDSEGEVRTTQSDPVVFRYATSLVKKPNLDIRDRIVREDPANRAYVVWLIAGLILIGLLALFVYELIRGRDVYQEASASGETDGSESDEAYLNRLSTGEARNQLTETLRAAHEGDVTDERAVAKSIKRFILAQVPEIPFGYTSSEVKEYVESIDNPYNREALVSLCEVMAYYESRGKGEFAGDVSDISETERLERVDSLADTFKWYRQTWYGFLTWLGGIRNRFSGLLSRLDQPGIEDEN